MLSQVIDAEHPDHLAVAFDVKGGTFRNQMLPQYKGTRDAAPEELLSQLPLIQQMLTALGVTYIEKPGYEGDDVIGTLASMGDQAGYRTLVLSGDRDAFQLINDNITVLYPGHHFKDLKHMTPDAVQEKYHVSPAQYPDLAALRGETADNIPGVPGVGDGFAAKWINQYGGLEQIIEHADEISGKKGEALRENIEQVKLNRSVNALVRDLDLGVSVSDLTFGQVDAGQLDDLFTKLEFGVRTKNRVLKTFNADKPSGDVHESSKLGLPHVEDVNDPHVVETWVQNHFPVVQEHLHERHERSSNDIPEFGFEIDSSTRCTDKVKQSWTLYAEGTSKPGEASLSALMIAVHAKPFASTYSVRIWCNACKGCSTAITIPWSCTVTKNMRICWAASAWNFRNHCSTPSSPDILPTRISTRTRWNRLRPISLICTSKHKPKPRHRGPWTSTSLRKTIPRTMS